MRDSQFLNIVRDLARICAKTADDFRTPVDELTTGTYLSGNRFRFGTPTFRATVLVTENDLILAVAMNEPEDLLKGPVLVPFLDIWNRVRDTIEKFHSGRTAIYTGHGLGGMAAIGLARMTRILFQRAVDDCVTFGLVTSPSTTAGWNPPLLSIINVGDPVALSGGGSLLAGDVWYLHEDGSITEERPSPCTYEGPEAHELAAYLDRLAMARDVAAAEELETPG